MPLVRSPALIHEMANERLRAFQHDLSTELSAIDLYEKFLRRQEPCVLTDEGVARLDSLFRRQWGLNENSLRLVGSAAFGFSIKPDRRFALFEEEASDIDVAIVDRDLFGDMWQEVHESTSVAFWYRQKQFEAHLYNGWIRPDVLPGSLGDKWFDFFRSIRDQEVFRRIKVRAALYPDDYFLEQYQCQGIDGCR